MSTGFEHLYALRLLREGAVPDAGSTTLRAGPGTLPERSA